jgi:hypothetical protein
VVGFRILNLPSGVGRRGEDAAHLVLRAAGRIGGGGTLSQVAESVASLGELGEALLDLGQVLVDQVGDVLAGCLAAVSDRQDAADLGEGESGGLGRVVPIADGGAVPRPAALPAAAADQGVDQPATRDTADRHITTNNASSLMSHPV